MLTQYEYDFCEGRFLDPNVSRAEAWQIGEALAWLLDRAQ